MSPDPVLIYLAGVSWDAVEGTDHRLVEHLSTELTTVWVDPPTSLKTRLSRMPVPVRGLSLLRPGLWRLHTVGPPGVTRAGVRRVAQWQVNRGMRRLPRAFAGRELVVLASRPDVDFRKIPGQLRVLHVTDDFVSGSDLLGLDATRIQRSLDIAMAHADIVLAVTASLAQRLTRGRAVGVLPNGCEPVVTDVPLADPPREVRLSQPIAGVVGQLNERLDLGILEGVADAGVSLLLIGPRGRLSPQASRRFDTLVRRGNVQWVGRKAYSELPPLLRCLHVGLTPYVDSQFNRSSDPLKTLEYLAAARPAVSTDLPAARLLDREVVDVVGSREEFVDAVLRRVATPLDRSVRDQCRHEAEKHSWSVRAAELLSILRAGSKPPADSYPTDLDCRVGSSVPADSARSPHAAAPARLTSDQEHS